MRQKAQADQIAEAAGLGGRLSYHRTYRMPPLLVAASLPGLLLVFGSIIAVGAAAGGAKFWAPTIILAIILAGFLAYVFVPPRHALRGVGVYDLGLVVLGGRRGDAIRWATISRVVHRKGRSESTFSGPFIARSQTVRVRYAFTQVWLQGETAPVHLAHIRRHRRLLAVLQAAGELAR